MQSKSLSHYHKNDQNYVSLSTLKENSILCIPILIQQTIYLRQLSCVSVTDSQFEISYCCPNKALTSSRDHPNNWFLEALQTIPKTVTSYQLFVSSFASIDNCQIEISSFVLHKRPPQFWRKYKTIHKDRSQMAVKRFLLSEKSVCVRRKK